ncbi:hypothetical protein RB195_006140 [Necator americanus]|uniref:Neurotransmitter-gated ion-channel ligand-binding domain-containing protein n=1 Tax=Necator americanus TaxID=51031 RepID=A0ABR1BR58_NECAM
MGWDGSKGIGIVLGRISGVYSHLDAPVSRVKLFIPRFRANEPAYVITCPRYTGRVGCFLDMTDYPNDKHTCSFIMSAKDQTNVVFYAGRRMQANKDFSVNLRHVLTRNDTRPRVSGWQINNVTSKISFYDYSNITETKTNLLSITVAVQTIHFSRNEPSHTYTQTIPALIFVSFNIAGALIQDPAHSMFLFLICLLFQGLFIRDFVGKIPLYYNSLPKILQFLVVQLLLSSFGFIFVTASEVRRRFRNQPCNKSKFPATFDEWTMEFFLKKAFSFAGSYIVVSLVSIFIFLV